MKGPKKVKNYPLKAYQTHPHNYPHYRHTDTQTKTLAQTDGHPNGQMGGETYGWALPSTLSPSFRSQYKLVSLIGLKGNCGRSDLTILDVQPEVFPYYMAADIVVMPSVMEPFGLVTCEAMAFSKPVIGSNIGEISEVIVHKQTGELILAKFYNNADYSLSQKNIPRLIQFITSYCSYCQVNYHMTRPSTKPEWNSIKSHLIFCRDFNLTVRFDRAIFNYLAEYFFPGQTVNTNLHVSNTHIVKFSHLDMRCSLVCNVIFLLLPTVEIETKMVLIGLVLVCVNGMCLRLKCIFCVGLYLACITIYQFNIKIYQSFQSSPVLLQAKVKAPPYILSHASWVGSPTNHLGSRQQQDTSSITRPPVNGPKDPWPHVMSLPRAQVVCWRPQPAGT